MKKKMSVERWKKNFFSFNFDVSFPIKLLKWGFYDVKIACLLDVFTKIETSYDLLKIKILKKI